MAGPGGRLLALLPCSSPRFWSSQDEHRAQKRELLCANASHSLDVALWLGAYGELMGAVAPSTDQVDFFVLFF